MGREGNGEVERWREAGAWVAVVVATVFGVRGDQGISRFGFQNTSGFSFSSREVVPLVI